MMLSLPSPTSNPTPAPYTLLEYSLPISSGPCLNDRESRNSFSSTSSVFFDRFLRLLLSRSRLKTSRPLEKDPTMEMTQLATLVVVEAMSCGGTVGATVGRRMIREDQHLARAGGGGEVIVSTEHPEQCSCPPPTDSRTRLSPAARVQAALSPQIHLGTRERDCGARDEI
jgi:hypothetical protein